MTKCKSIHRCLRFILRAPLFLFPLLASCSNVSPGENMGERVEYGIGHSAELAYNQDHWRVWRIADKGETDCIAMKFDEFYQMRFIKPEFGNAVAPTAGFPGFYIVRYQGAGLLRLEFSGKHLHLKDRAAEVAGKQYFLSVDGSKRVSGSYLTEEEVLSWDGQKAKVEIMTGEYAHINHGVETLKGTIDMTGVVAAIAAVKRCGNP